MANKALLIMDVQRRITEMIPGGGPALLQNIKHAQEAARAAGIPVIFVKIGFREGYPEISPANVSFSGIKAQGWFGPDDEMGAVHPDVAPLPGELVIDKKRVSAFAGNDLQMILASKGITELVLSGIATSGIVLSTVRQAFDLDFKLTVLADCCVDRSEEVHNILVGKIFPNQATVQTAAEWAASLKA
ncbi:cysteine hydrolase family protein [Chitinophaga sp. Cy-1792]|uniref:cysteine hydrolase family protein n=1 Tax=Chitinophaga sp. Cy-1792 TaxID=2608339 RepID=UPI0014231BC0|nr:isochorismatase family cysteine hydrolase [Chitinophaga sp. Cy-1792]NIG57495.1 cysteine hydrolase [Chitinophaga sp. Cy-1792]